MRAVKAIIPAAGLGTRLRPLTYTRPKPVLRVAGKPIIVHAIETLQAAGITDDSAAAAGDDAEDRKRLKVPSLIIRSKFIIILLIIKSKNYIY